MDESENTVQERAQSGEEIPRRVCAQILSSDLRYQRWHSRHEHRMDQVAKRRRRDLQILGLRTAALEQIHRAALVCYLRDRRITGAARDLTLAEFYAVLDPRDAAVTEHHHYLIAASSRLCTLDFLRLAGDVGGLRLIDAYEAEYSEFFGLFCDRARALRTGSTDLLGALMPEAREAATRLRNRILEGDRLPPRPVRPRPTAAKG